MLWHACYEMCSVGTNAAQRPDCLCNANCAITQINGNTNDPNMQAESQTNKACDLDLPSTAFPGPDSALQYTPTLLAQ